MPWYNDDMRISKKSKISLKTLLNEIQRIGVLMEEDSDKIKMTIQLCRDKGDYEIVIKKVNPHINFQINKIDEEKPT